jgi:stress response protein SCP2
VVVAAAGQRPAVAVAQQFLLTDQGTVRSDNDMVFYGQPDHTTGAVSLAADDTGATTALHVTPRALPSAITEILLTAQLSTGRFESPSQVHVLDLDTGTALGHIDLPTPGATGLLQLGALQRTASGWALQPQPAQLDLDLASPAAAAGVSVE